MIQSEAEKEILFKKCKQSVEDVFGWKVFIFLPHNFVWKLLIVITVFISYVINTSHFFYRKKHYYSDLIVLICELIYVVDTLCATLHYAMVNTRKLRHAKKRHMGLLFIDYISLLPFSMVFDYLIYSGEKDVTEFFRINASFRVYQIYLFFSNVKMWIYKVKIYFIVIFIEMNVYFLLISHLLSCFLYLNFDNFYSEKCLNDFFFCLSENEMTTYILMSQRYLKPIFEFPLQEYTVFLTFCFVTGYVFTYGYLIPMLLFLSLKYLRGYFEFSNRFKQLKLLVDNMIEDKSLKNKTIAYFESLWRYGRGVRNPEILQYFPPCLQKNIFCDIHWDVFRHSEFLDCLSIGCKRSLSLYIRTEFIDAKTILLKKKDKKTNFMYLETGMLQIMAEESSKYPVISFSGGTVLGESALFLPIESKAILRTAQFSVIHFLSFRDLFLVLLDYPKDLKKLFKRMRFRMKVAISTYERKMEICPQFLQSSSNYSVAKTHEQESIKWIKEQYRAVWGIHKTQESTDKNTPSGQNIRQTQNLQTQLEHTSLYLSLLCINDEVVSKYEAVCLKMSFPWIMDPQSSFIILWNRIVLAVAASSALVYPVFIGWSPYFPVWFVDVSVFTSFIYIIDVVIQLLTAVKLKNIVISKFWAMLLIKVTSISFHADIAAALPIYFVAYYRKKDQKPFSMNFYLINALIKTYRLFPFLESWNYSVQSRGTWRTLIKYLFILAISLYWFAAIINTAGVECLFYECDDQDWYSVFRRDNGDKFREYAALFFSVSLGLDIPLQFSGTDNFIFYAIIFVAFIFFHFLFLIWQSEYTSSYVLENSHEIKYKNLMDYVFNFMNRRKIVGLIKKRVMDTMQFQWRFDYGDYITQEHRILDDIEEKLRDEIDRQSILSTVASSTLFGIEDEIIHLDLCKKAQRLALPANSILITFGTQTMCIYIIHKGYAQMSSFLPGDIVQNVGRAITLQTGDLFPIIVALNQMPAALSARTITDCELIVLELEDVLSTMIVHGIFKDIVEAVKTIDMTPFSSARLGLSRVEDVFKVDEKSFKAAFDKLKWFGFILRYFFLRKAINSRSPSYVQWELSRVVCVIIGLTFWPFVYGIFTRTDVTVLMYLLLAVDSLTWADFYIRMHVAFYNKKGIYVTHPLSTTLHYLTTSFSLDLVAFIPHLHLLCLLLGKWTYLEVKVGPWTRVIHIFMRMLGLYRLFGFIDYLKDIRKFLKHIEFFKYALVISLMVNAYINLMVHYYIMANTKPKFYFNQNLKDVSLHPGSLYFRELGLALFLILRIQYHFNVFDIGNIIIIVIFALFGWLTEIFFFSILTLSSTSANLNFTIYQYYMKSFLNFLIKEKAEDSITIRAIEHFEYEWEKKKGEDLHKIFSHFPYILHEDLMFPLYKKTLSAIQCLSDANEAFYRILSRHMREVHLKKGSVIIFENEVQDDIFFIHRGQCFVENYSKTLYKGAMIGDIHRRGIMNSKIRAATHVVLLKLSSQVFFLTMNNFHRTKTAFEKEVANLKDFIESIRVSVRDEVVEEIIDVKVQEFMESEFEEVDNKRNNVKEDTQQIKKKGKFGNIINPESRKSRLIRGLVLLSAYFTIVVIPIFFVLRSLSLDSLIILYTLDVVWILKIVTTLRTAYFNPKTGNLITNRQSIFENYIHRLDGLIVDLISTLPFEIFPFVYFKLFDSYEYCHYVPLCYVNRLLRILHIRATVIKEKKKLSMNIFVRWMTIIWIKMAAFNLFASVNLLVFRYQDLDTCYWQFSMRTFDILIWSYLCLVNTFIGGGMYICAPVNDIQVLFQALVGLWSTISKVHLINEVLSIIYVTHRAKLDQMHKLEQMEKYLTVRDISPILFQRVRRYFCDLIDTYKEGALPSFMATAPAALKVDIMTDLYNDHLSDCYIFQGLENTFLKQLAARMQRYIFFPGDYITEKGDVDRSIYFIHKGEVYCIQKDEHYPALEEVVDLFTAGESFGVLQGILLCCPHPYTYRAKTLVEILVLNFDDWKDLRLAFPDITKTIYKRTLKTKDVANN